MRILQYSFFSLLFICLSVFVLFAVAQEILMFWGVTSVQSAATTMKKANTADVCQTYLNQYSTEGIVVGYQLRFNSDTEFVTEAFCKPFNSNIKELKTHTLPPFISKIPGSSGLMYGTESSSVGLQAFENVYSFLEEEVGISVRFLQKKRFITAKNEVLISESKVTNVGQTPATSCEGFGYVCCNSVTELGDGAQITNTTNCERSCFNRCLRRPSILSFMSDPFPDLETRTVAVTAGVPVEFQYLSDVQGTAALDFGDGESATSVGTSGSAQHVYTCRQRTCEYTATLTITDGNNRTSAVSPLSTLHIIVSP